MGREAAVIQKFGPIGNDSAFIRISAGANIFTVDL
jgi:hypothetical protein